MSFSLRNAKHFQPRTSLFMPKIFICQLLLRYAADPPLENYEYDTHMPRYLGHRVFGIAYHVIRRQAPTPTLFPRDVIILLDV